MKIALLNDSFPPVIDGVANAVYNYASTLCKEDEVVVGTPNYPEADYTKYPFSVIPYTSFNTTSFASGYRTGNPFDLKAIQEVTRFQPDLIHSHCPIMSTYLAKLVRNVTDSPIILTYHTKYDVDIKNAITSELLQKKSIEALVSNISSCDEVWAVSEGAKENLYSLGYKGECKVVYNGVDFEKGKANPELVQEATKDYDLPPGVPVFLFVGRLMKYKGIPLLIEAFKRLYEKDIPFRFVLIGDGADRDSILQEVIDKKLPYDTNKIKSDYAHGKILFTGAIQDRAVLKAWNTRADVFLFPSTFDTNGLVVREAAACGLASMLIEGSCAAEGIVDGRNGFLVQQEVDSIAEFLETISQNLPLAEACGERAMEEIYLSWEDAIGVARKNYELVLEKKDRGEYKHKQQETSLMNQAITQSLTDFIYLTEAPTRMKEGMLDNMNAFTKDVKLTHNQLLAIKAHVQARLAQDATIMEKEIKKSLNEVYEGIQRLTNKDL